MGGDIENPDTDGCVAEEEPSRITIKERLVASFLRNPNDAGGGDGGDDKAAEPPHVAAGGGAKAAEPVQWQCGWRVCVLYLCSAISPSSLPSHAHIPK
jgi:hypothetical protein